MITTRIFYIIQGTGFVSWITEKSLSPEDALYLTISSKGILIGKVPCEPQHKRACHEKLFSRSKSIELDTLADAAHYARAHGTPGIRAILSYPDEQQNNLDNQEICEVDGKTFLSDCKPSNLLGAGIESEVPHQTLKSSSRTSEGPKLALADMLLMNARVYHDAMPGIGQAAYQHVKTGTKVPMTSGVNSKLGLVAFAAVMQALSKHIWTPEERQVVGEFRTKFGEFS